MGSLGTIKLELKLELGKIGPGAPRLQVTQLFGTVGAGLRTGDPRIGVPGALPKKEDPRNLYTVTVFSARKSFDLRFRGKRYTETIYRILIRYMVLGGELKTVLIR